MFDNSRNKMMQTTSPQARGRKTNTRSTKRKDENYGNDDDDGPSKTNKLQEWRPLIRYVNRAAPSQPPTLVPNLRMGPLEGERLHTGQRPLP